MVEDRKIVNESTSTLAILTAWSRASFTTEFQCGCGFKRA